MGFLRRKYGHKYPCNDARFVPRAVTSFEISNYYNRCHNIFYLLRQQCWRRLNFCAIKIQRSITETEFILKWILKRISWQTRSQVFHLATMRGSFHAALKFRINSRFDHYYNPCYIFLFFYFISFDNAYRRKLNFLRQTSYYRNVELILKKDYYYSKLIRAYYIILFFYSRRKKEIIEMLN